VHDADAVRVGEAVGDRGHHGRRLRRRQRPPGPQHLAHAAAGDQLHHQTERVADGEQFADRDDVLVLQRGEDRALLHEPGHGLGLWHQLVAEQLDRHLLAGGLVARAPHGAGGAATDLLEQLVTAADHTRGRLGGFRRHLTVILA
jgi:hypothetical protein